MRGTITEKILSAHLIYGELVPGKEIGIRIDQTLTQDATGTMAYLQFEAIGIPRVKTEISVSYVDHNTLQSDYRNMDDHIFLESAAEKYGLYFSRPGNGICHQVHLERFGLPGKTLIGSDSHTPTGGGLGMFALGTGGLDVAVAMAGGPLYLTCPKITGVKLKGRLRPFCSAKDIILTLLRRETVKGGVGRVYEYFGEGTEALSIYQRATITNMGAELGATTSLFPSDEKTKTFLAAQGRSEGWVPLVSNPEAEWEEIIEIDLSSLEPMAAMPHMPDKVVPVREIAGISVQQVAIGSCTNSSLGDLGAAADILAGATIPPGVSLGISPGSRQVLLSAYKTGIIQNLVKSGARILECACGPCIGMGFAPGSGGVSLRTFNRNFKGRSGSEDAQVYLVSPETAAASAARGVITDPRDCTSVKLKVYDSPAETDDSMIIPPLPLEEAETLKIKRGPNIAALPKGSPLPEELALNILIKTGDNITTDDIMPAGAKVLPLRSNIPEISKFVFAALDPDFYEKAKKYGPGIIVGGENYGQGSSREHAALAPMYLGVRAVLAKSFARIHKANLINFGIIPMLFQDPADYDRIVAGKTLSFAHLKKNLVNGQSSQAVLEGESKPILIKWDLDERSKDIIIGGGLLAYTRKGING